MSYLILHLNVVCYLIFQKYVIKIDVKTHFVIKIIQKSYNQDMKIVKLRVKRET